MLRYSFASARKVLMIFAIRFSARARFLSATADSESSYVSILLLLLEEPLDEEIRIYCLFYFPGVTPLQSSSDVKVSSNNYICYFRSALTCFTLDLVSASYSFMRIYSIPSMIYIKTRLENLKGN